MVSGLVVGIGASAGGIEALACLLPQLRAEWEIAFAIVLHRQVVEREERLENVLNLWSTLPVGNARDGEPIVGGRVVVAPAGVHLLVGGDGRYRFSSAPRERHARPSVDVLFRSIGEACGKRGGGVVLSGLLDDGAAGIDCVRSRGGLTLAQNPDEALFDGMPRSAIAAGAEAVGLSRMPQRFGAFARGAGGLVRSSPARLSASRGG
ncbi:MAG TPA: chemotaxis protein CheB [Candidatus Acidoferrales bacterium]|nr:chemotaxis protein CheB [Candidatus Acidoferrales bacterium]